MPSSGQIAQDRAKYASSAGVASGTRTEKTPIYGNVLDTAKYNAFVEQKQQEFNQRLANKKSEVEVQASSQIAERTANYQGREKFVQGLEAKDRSFAEQRFGAEKTQQEALVTKANQDIEDYSNTEFNKTKTEVENAKGQFTSRKVIGYKTTTYRTQQVEKPVVQVSEKNYGTNAPFANTPQGADAQKKYEEKVSKEKAIRDSEFLQTMEQVANTSTKFNSNLSISKDSKTSYSPPVIQKNPEVGNKIDVLTKIDSTKKYDYKEPSPQADFAKGVIEGPLELITQSAKEARADSERLGAFQGDIVRDIAIIPGTSLKKSIEVMNPVTAVLSIAQGNPVENLNNMVSTPKNLGKTIGTIALFEGLSKGGARALYGKDLSKFGTVKSIATESDGSINLQTAMKAKTGGLVGKQVEITGNFKLTPLDIEKFFGKNNFLKIKGGIERVGLPEKTSMNLVRLEAGNKVLLLPEKIVQTVVEQKGTQLILKKSELAKLKDSFGKSLGGEPNVSGLEPSLGQPFAVSSEGVVRVRKIGLTERVTNALDFRKTDFVKEVSEAQRKGIKFGKTEEVSGVSVGTVQDRKIIVNQNAKANMDFGFGGFNQNTLDIKRIGNDLKLLPEKIKQVFSKNNEVGEFTGRIRFEKDLGVKEKPNVSITGKKGVVENIEYSKNGDVISSGKRGFKTQDIEVSFNKDNKIQASRSKVEGYPMEFKTLTVKRKVSDLPKGDTFSELIQDRLRKPKENKLLNEPQKRLSRVEKKLLTGPRELTALEKRFETALDKYKKSGNKLSSSQVNASAQFFAGKGTVLAQKLMDKPSSGLQSVAKSSTNFVKNGSTGTIQLNKIKEESQSSSKSSQINKQKNIQQNSFAQRKSMKDTFSEYALMKTIQAEKIRQSQKELNLDSQLQSSNISGDLVIPKSTQSELVTQIESSSTINSFALRTNSLTRQAERINERTAQRVNYGFSVYRPPTPVLVQMQAKRRQLFEEPKKKKRKVIFDVSTRSKGREVIVGKNLDFGQAVRRGRLIAENTARQTFALKRKGFIETEEGPSSSPGFNRFRKPAQRSALNKLGDFVFVQQRKYAISSRGEKIELKNARRRK